MSVTVYNNKQIMILQNLAKYKFLTYKQMSRLGIDNYTSNLSTLLKGLRECRYPLVKKIPHQIGTPVKHYLTKKGKDILVKLSVIDEEQIHFPEGAIFTDTQDQKHRTSIIDIQIELDIACTDEIQKLLVCERYFDTQGNNRIAKNLKSKTAFFYKKNKIIIADLIFILEINEGKELYLLELENGNDTKKAIVKIFNHADAIFSGSANQKYNIPKAYRSIWVFEYKSTMDSVINRMKDDPYLFHIKENFLFKSLKDINASSFFNDWINLEGKERKLFY